MDYLKPLFALLQDNPLFFAIGFATIAWWLERTERVAQQKINAELQTSMIQALEDVKSAITHNSTLLQFLGGGGWRGSND